MRFSEDVRPQDPLEFVAENLAIPPSYYKLVDERYENLAEWLEREDSLLWDWEPKIYTQGSFRQGTVTWRDGAYDLDVVVELTRLGQGERSQLEVKAVLRAELENYRKHIGLTTELKSGKRCVTLTYAPGDGPEFHIDVLVVVPEDPDVKKLLADDLSLHGTPSELAELAVRFTDTRHDDFERRVRYWQGNMSNPGGYGKWFEDRAEVGVRELLEKRAEEIPPREWDTPVQQAVRIIKAHRNQFFDQRAEMRPSSIVLTTLAAEAYRKEVDLEEVLIGVVDRFEHGIDKGRVLNPTNPNENFASKWGEVPGLVPMFREWLAELKKDVRRLQFSDNAGAFLSLVQQSFGKRLEESDLSGLRLSGARSVRSVQSRSKPAPWRST